MHGYTTSHIHTCIFFTEVHKLMESDSISPHEPEASAICNHADISAAFCKLIKKEGGIPYE